MNQSVENNEQMFEMLKKVAEGETVLHSVMSVKDLARNSFMGTRTVNAVREAQRDFKYLVENDPVVSKSPADFELYQIGVFNPSSGQISGITPTRISRGTDFVAVKV